MINPDDLDNEAMDIETEALETQAQASALATSGDPDQQAQARKMDGLVLTMHLRARQRHKEAQKLRAKIQEIDKQLDDRESRVQKLEQEKSSIGDVDTMIGQVAHQEADAKAAEKLAASLKQKDDDYSQKEAAKMDLKAQEHRQQAEKIQNEADNLRSKHLDIDSQITKLHDEISDLENQKRNASV